MNTQQQPFQGDEYFSDEQIKRLSYLMDEFDSFCLTTELDFSEFPDYDELMALIAAELNATVARAKEKSQIVVET